MANKIRQPYFEIFKGRLRWRWNLVGANGEVVAVSQAYWSKSNAIRAAVRLAEAMSLRVKTRE